LAWVGANGKLLLMAGQLDTTNYMDHNAYANAHYNNLTNSVFSNNPMLPLTDNTLGFHFAYQPTESFYMMGAIAGNNVDQNQNPFKRFDSKNITAVTEFGYIIDDILGMGSGTYRLQPFWTKSNDKNGGGIGVNFQQQLGKNTHLGWFFRGGWASYQAAAVTGVRCAATTGIVYLSPFVGSGASNDSYLGLGFLWQQGATANGPYNNKNEYGMELTYVMQVTPTMTLQPDFQIIKDPVNGKKGQTAVVFQIQNVWSF
jgi:porin